MNEQEKLAREWAEKNYPELVEVAEGTLAADLLEKARAAAEFILARTTPSTMADVVWDDEKHYLAGATCDGDPCVMLKDRTDGKIWMIDLNLKGLYYALAADLTPNGKRYRLVEKPDHPEVLETVHDFRSAPEGTVVACDGMSPWWKIDADTWERIYDEKSDTGMACQHGVHKVLRWGDDA